MKKRSSGVVISFFSSIDPLRVRMRVRVREKIFQLTCTRTAIDATESKQMTAPLKCRRQDGTTKSL